MTIKSQENQTCLFAYLNSKTAISDCVYETIVWFKRYHRYCRRDINAQGHIGVSPLQSIFSSSEFDKQTYQHNLRVFRNLRAILMASHRDELRILQTIIDGQDCAHFNAISRFQSLTHDRQKSLIDAFKTVTAAIKRFQKQDQAGLNSEALKTRPVSVHSSLAR